MSAEGRVVIRKIPTGVQGLDEILGGGLPEYSFNIIAGAPGGGKTTLPTRSSSPTPRRNARASTSPCWASRPSRCSATSSSSGSSTWTG
jgi:replicative DNA helicase